jgi:hypothetical protein
MTILLSSMIYPRECLGETIAAFTDLCSVNIGREQNKNYSIEIIPDPTVSNEEVLTNEFLNYLLGVSIKDHFINCVR